VRALGSLALLLLVPVLLAAQADSTPPRWIRFRTQPAFVLREPPIYSSPWLGGPRRDPAEAGKAWLEEVERASDSVRVAELTAYRLRRVYGRRAVAEEDTVTQRGGVLGLSRRYADLNIDGQSRLEIRTERIKNHRCTAAQYLDLSSGCRSGWKAPRLDTYLSMRAGGLIGQRLHVDVDYDTERDFDARNNLLIYYEGLEDEVIRRVEVGTVTFRPPPSRYLTAAIPANNFGVNATIQVGALEVQAMAATQEGSQIAERTYSVGTSTRQPQDREARDLDFEAKRFFWVLDPRTLPGYPSLDILALGGAARPPDAPTSTSALRVYRYRPAGRAGTNPNLGGITAVALGADPTQRVTAQWELLVPNTDYYVDPSALWVALTRRLDENEYLAVSYQAPTGQVGTFPSQDSPVAPGQPPRDTLRLIVEPRVDATRPTFHHEMRHVYVVAGGDLDLSSVQVGLTLNRSEKPLGNPAGTYLAAFGLATPDDPTVFNLPDRLFPRAQDPAAALVLPEKYIVFPSLRPFADPNVLTPPERNDSLYNTPGYLLLTEGPPAKFVFRLRYATTAAGDLSSLDLGALQIRQGSEQLMLNGRRLERDVDYTINYDLGKVTFTNPRALFGNGGGAITARFEERGIFAVAPTQIYGLATRYALGDIGGINLVGVYQVEQSAFNRPQLGFESSAQMMGGITTDLRFRPEAVTRFLNRLTSTPTTAPSRLDINGELALSRPDPNRSGQAYLESFEGDPGLPVSLRETAWQLGNVPRFADGVDQLVGFAFDTADAVQLTWQNLIAEGGTPELRASDIDPQLQVAGQGDQLETVLYMALHPDTSGGQTRRNNTLRWTLPMRPNAPRWRSMTTALSLTGTDLSRNEYLEFWVFQNDSLSAQQAGVRLVVDLGEVGEDALAFAPATATITAGDSLYQGRVAVGVGRLDSEADPVTGIFNASSDDRGILGDRPDSLVVNGVVQEQPSLCTRQLTGSVLVFPWGDLDARCSRGNGTLDTEDLDGDNRLDAAGPTDNTLRWVVDLTDTTRYFVRRGVTTPTGVGGWVLYRIPIRNPEFRLGTPNLRLVKHLRLTVVAPPDQGGPDIQAKFAIARVRFLGSSWVRRSDRPVAGLAGGTANPAGAVVVSTVSTENSELGYTSPPGVRSGLDRKGGSQGEFGTVINERSLRIVASGLALNDRAEGYLRFPSGSRNLLRYRELRVWARGRGAGWDNGDFRAYIRVGSDARNFYQFSQPARTTTWEPEMRIDLEKWRDLRARLETRRLQGLPADSVERVACGGDPLSVAYVACDDGYLVYIEDPGVTPPNLASVQEVAVGIYRTAALDPSDSTELWIDDIRLVEPISTVGTAMALDARLVASNVGEISVGFTRRDGRFQQIGSEPTYQTTSSFTASTSVQADRFLPPGLGIALPVAVSYTRTAVAAELLSGTDVLRSDLRNVREPGSRNLNWSVGIRRVERGKHWLVRGLLDPLSLSAAFSTSSATAELSQSESHSHAFNAGYNLAPGAKRLSLGLGGLVDRLPGFLKNSEAGTGLRNAAFTLSPTSVRLTSGLARAETDLLSFTVPVHRAADSAVVPVTSLSHTWRNSAGVSWQPLGMLTLSADLSSTRDLREYPDTTTLGRLTRQSRRSFLGLDVGVERDRQLSTSLGLAPRVTRWLRPRFSTSSSFVLSRSLTSRSPVREDGDSAGAYILPQTLNTSRTNEVGAALELGVIVARIFGDSSALGRASRRIRPFDISDRTTRIGTWDLAAFDPGLGFQLGLGGLDDFLLHEGERAISAAEVKSTTFSSGFDLPVGLSLALSYSRTRNSRFQRSGGGFFLTETFQTEWPKGNVRFTRPLSKGPVALFSVGANFRVTDGSTATPSGAGTPVITAVYSRNLTPDASLTFRNGIVLAGSFLDFTQDREGNGRATKVKQNDINLSLSHSFPLPRALSRVQRLVRGQLSTTHSVSTTCLDQPGVTVGCFRVSDTRRQEYRASLDTDLLRTMSGGLQFSYSINEARHLDRKVSQLILTMAFQLSLFSGDYR
jgi:hypothetical protein